MALRVSLAANVTCSCAARTAHRCIVSGYHLESIVLLFSTALRWCSRLNWTSYAVKLDLCALGRPAVIFAPSPGLEIVLGFRGEVVISFGRVYVTK